MLLQKGGNINLLLKYIFNVNYGEHYPNDVINLILMDVYEVIFPLVSCGFDHTIIKIDNTIYGCGYNKNNQLEPTQHTKYDKICPNLQKIPISNIKNVECWNRRTYFTSYLNHVYIAGSGMCNIDVADIEYLNDGTILRRLNNEKQHLNLEKFDYTSYFIKSFKLTDQIQNIKSIAKATDYSLILTTTGDVYKHTDNDTQQIILPKIKTISCGCFYNIAVSVLGEIYVWGDNSYGQLGLGHKIDQAEPTRLIIPF